ncbi:hypothetical protein LCGC14_0949220 [marine sediment metagenome]|uniref:Uncharacterized protein n=1 Tax=marine sediment metagenome TaxID=412755 RepID=A0A0F9NMJ5_9ZZZZ
MDILQAVPAFSSIMLIPIYFILRNINNRLTGVDKLIHNHESRISYIEGAHTVEHTGE